MPSNLLTIAITITENTAKKSQTQNTPKIPNATKTQSDPEKSSYQGKICRPVYWSPPNGLIQGLRFGTIVLRTNKTRSVA